MPCLRGTDPTSSAQLARSNASSALLDSSIPARGGNAQSSSSITTPSRDFIAGSISSMRSTTGWSGPNIWPEAIRNTSA